MGHDSVTIAPQRHVWGLGAFDEGLVLPASTLQSAVFGHKRGISAVRCGGDVEAIFMTEHGLPR